MLRTVTCISARDSAPGARAVSSRMLVLESASHMYGGDLDAAAVPNFLANATRTRFGACGLT